MPCVVHVVDELVKVLHLGSSTHDVGGRPSEVLRLIRLHLVGSVEGA